MLAAGDLEGASLTRYEPKARDVTRDRIDLGAEIRQVERVNDVLGAKLKEDGDDMKGLSSEQLERLRSLGYIK